MAERTRVVIVGGGFGGLAAARGLARAPVEVTLIDRQAHHVFQPLLYQVATAYLGAPEITAPIRRVLRRQKNARVLMGEVAGVDVERREVVLEGGERLPYDVLVVATGSVDDYFGHEDWRAHAPGLKDVAEAVAIRSRILGAFERAEAEADPERRRALLTFVLVGGGPTGVELAGAVAELSRGALAGEFRSIDPGAARVVVVEAQDRILGSYEQRLAERARRHLERLGVEVRTGERVEEIDADGVIIGGERLEARTVVWTAGVRASPLAESLGAPLDERGRVRVEPDLSVPGRPEIFVVGDLAHLEQDGALLPGVAQVALQGGRHVARTIRTRMKGGAPEPFHYRDKGQLAVIGRSYAVAQLAWARLSGLAAWLIWAFVHILFLIGFRNKVVVMLEWAFAYTGRRRGARLIMQGRPPPLPAESSPPSLTTGETKRAAGDGEARSPRR